MDGSPQSRNRFPLNSNFDWFFVKKKLHWEMAEELQIDLTLVKKTEYSQTNYE